MFLVLDVAVWILLHKQRYHNK